MYNPSLHWFNSLSQNNLKTNANVYALFCQIILMPMLMPMFQIGLNANDNALLCQLMLPKPAQNILCISRILLLSITTIIFNIMTVFDVTLDESTWTLLEIMHTTCRLPFS